MGRIGRNGQIWKTANPPGRFTPRYALRRVKAIPRCKAAGLQSDTTRSKKIHLPFTEVSKLYRQD